MSDDKTPLTLRQKIGVGLFVVLGPILTEQYWRNNGDLPFSGSVSVWTLVAVAAAGCALGLWLTGQTPGNRLIGLLSGALAGAGSAVAFQLCYGGVNRAGSERWLIHLLGMAPGLLIGFGLLRWTERKSKEAAPPTP